MKAKQATFHLYGIYFLTFLIAFGLKSFSDVATVDQLHLLLYPISIFVEIFTNNSFIYELDQGYISADQRIIIDKSCSGINYFIIVFSLLIFSFLAKFKHTRLQYLAFFAFGMTAYAYTILDNVARITSAIHLIKVESYLPVLQLPIMHTFQGTIFYFGFLLILFLSMHYFFQGSLYQPLSKSRRF